MNMIIFNYYCSFFQLVNIFLSQYASFTMILLPIQLGWRKKRGGGGA